MNCRHCFADLTIEFCDLHTCPPSNSMLEFKDLSVGEYYYPLKVYVCSECWLVQVDEVKKATEIFSDNYSYFSSFSSSWLIHSKNYVEYMINRFGFGRDSMVMEIASNDGYLLQYFLEEGIQVLGIEPTSNTAQVAIDRGIPTIIDFFGSDLASRELVNSADLVIGNNVLAHVPNVNDFVRGVYMALKEDGIATFEFPHLYQLVECNQFDTIYHEHFSYFSLNTVKRIFENCDLLIFDVQEISTHGGSLRVFAKRKSSVKSMDVSSTVSKLLAKERNAGLLNKSYYAGFQNSVDLIKDAALRFLLESKRSGNKVIGYGAAAKGNTLLNFCGLRGTDLIEYVVDKSTFKLGKFLPGSRIPVLGEDRIKLTKPDFIIIFPWNLKDEIMDQLAYCRDWGCKFVVFIPKLTIFD